MIALKQILVATDFGEPAKVALDYARDFARAFSARVHLVHVVDDIASHGTPLAAPAVDLSRLQSELEAEARDKLGALLDPELRQAGAIPVVLTSSRPASAILSYAADAKVDLIVAGTHGRTGFADLFMGSVAQQLVRLAACPVLTLRQGSAHSSAPERASKELA